MTPEAAPSEPTALLRRHPAPAQNAGPNAKDIRDIDFAVLPHIHDADILKGLEERFLFIF